MPNYDFHILQPAEFEELSRDLLQKYHGVFIESFTDGRDGGIDLRFAKDGKRNIIVQAKRYKDWNSLRTVLYKEKDKLAKLNPSRYILTTSVGLTPTNKSEIADIFFPYIKSTEDIIGRDDLNNLLGMFPDVETKHYKLWLASTNVLRNIVQSATVNRSAFELETIREEIATYVMNPSFDKARKLLNDNGIVIISGIPGIGKTTLARMLIYYFLSRAADPGAPEDLKNFEEFVYIPDSMETAMASFNKDVKQIFFFDDFLGDIAFHKKENGFDRDLVAFMKAVKRNKDNKHFILATREHILSEAMMHYKNLSMEEHDIPKCVVTLADYTNVIKARILYNHMAVSNLTQGYIEAFLRNKVYRQLIKHENFNPRIIEIFIRRNQWRQYSPEEFEKKFIEVFDRPEAVWEMAFDNLSQFAQFAMLILVTMGSEVDLDDWQIAFRYFCDTTKESIGLAFSDNEWRKTLKILQECFIRITILGDHRLVSAYNPSVRDFIIVYLQKSPSLVRSILAGVMYSDQISNIFRDTVPSDEFLSEFLRKSTITLSEDDMPIVMESLNRIAANGWKSCRIVDRHSVKLHARPNRYEQMSDICLHFYSELFRKSGFIAQQFSVEDLIDEDVDLRLRLRIIASIDWNDRRDDLKEIFSCIYDENIRVEAFCELHRAQGLLGLWLTLDFIKDDNEWVDELTEAVFEDMESSISSYADLEMKEGLYNEAFSEFGISSLPDEVSNALDELRMEFEDDVDEEDYYEWEREMGSYEDKQEKMNREIDAIMTALRK